MDSLEQLSNVSSEVMDVEKDSINTNIINIDRNKIEAIPKTNQVQIYMKNKFKINIIYNIQNMVIFVA